MHFRHLRFAGLALALATAPFAALAQWKPERPVTLVVPYAPGGGTDAQARAVAQELSRIWGQPVVVENAAGADGAIGTRKVIDAKPDGYTLLVQIPSITVLKNLPASKGFDPVSQLVPVSAYSSLPGVFVANAGVPGKTLAEVVRHCKAAPQPCSYGTTENVARLQGRQFAAEAGMENMIVVNYKGGGQLITDLVANNVNFSLMGVTAALPHYKSGALKILATAGRKRSAALPDVPSAVEAGFPAFDAVTWYGLFAPRGTPPATVDAIAAAVREAIKGDAVHKTLNTIGADALGTTPAEFAAMVRAESERNDALARRFPLD